MTPSLLKERVTNSCLNEVSESFIPDDFIGTAIFAGAARRVGPDRMLIVFGSVVRSVVLR